MFDKPRTSLRYFGDLDERSNVMASGVPVNRVKSRNKSENKTKVKKRRSSQNSTVTYGQRKVKMQNRRSKLKAIRPSELGASKRSIKFR